MTSPDDFQYERLDGTPIRYRATDAFEHGLPEEPALDAAAQVGVTEEMVKVALVAWDHATNNSRSRSLGATAMRAAVEAALQARAPRASETGELKELRNFLLQSLRTFGFTGLKPESLTDVFIARVRSLIEKQTEFGRGQFEAFCEQRDRAEAAEERASRAEAENARLRRTSGEDVSH